MARAQADPDVRARRRVADLRSSIRGWPRTPTWADRVVFFDVETTGLSGGAGTLAFLAGCGWFEDDGFHVRQFFLSGPAGERAMLRRARRRLRRRVAARHVQRPLVRRAADGDAMGVPPPRRADRDAAALRHAAARAPTVGPAGEADVQLPLSSLERSRASALHRLGDVPGFEIPTRYFQFLRTGDVRAIEGVLEHNRHDVVSLAAVTAHALAIARDGRGVLRLSGRAARARPALRTCGRSGARRRRVRAGRGGRAIARSAVRRSRGLAVLRRREHEYDEAAAAWQDVLDLSTCRRGVGARAKRRRGARDSSRASRPRSGRPRGATPRRSARAPRAGWPQRRVTGWIDWIERSHAARSATSALDKLAL